MAVAAAGAVVLGQVGEAASLAFLFSISEALEAFALVHARRSLRALLSIVPNTATVAQNATVSDTPDSFRLITRGIQLTDDGPWQPGFIAAIDFRRGTRFVTLTTSQVQIL